MSSPTVRVSRSLYKDRDRRTGLRRRRSTSLGTGRDRQGPCRDRCGPARGSERSKRSAPMDCRISLTVSNAAGTVSRIPNGPLTH